MGLIAGMARTAVVAGTVIATQKARILAGAR